MNRDDIPDTCLLEGLEPIEYLTLAAASATKRKIVKIFSFYKLYNCVCKEHPQEDKNGEIHTRSKMTQKKNYTEKELYISQALWWSPFIKSVNPEERLF